MLRYATLFPLYLLVHYTFPMKTELLYQIVSYIQPEEYPSFSQRLHFVMTLRGYSVRMLAERIYVSPSTISGYRTGNRLPDCLILSKIAKELQVSTDFLLGLIDYVTVPPQQR